MMMNFKKLLVGTVAAQLLVASAVMAQGAETIVTLTKVTPAPGQTVAAQVIMPDGTSVPATEGMALPNGAQLVVMEGASVQGTYDKQGCAVQYDAKTKLDVKKSEPCSKGTKITETKTVKKTTITTNTPVVEVPPPVYTIPKGFLAATAGLTVVGALSADSINDNKPKTP